MVSLLDRSSGEKDAVFASHRPSVGRVPLGSDACAAQGLI